MNIISQTVFCTSLLISPILCHAGIRPSFNLDYAAWHATDILVATEGDKLDGNLTALGVWKGVHAAGERISVPELATFADIGARTVSTVFSEESAGDVTRVVSGARIVLFLVETSRTAKTVGQPGTSEWQPASRFGGMQVSVVWIDGGRAYAFTQIMNPGPSVLTEQRYSEGDIKKRVHDINTTQKALMAIATEPQADVRAREAASFLRSDIYYARKEAFRIMAESGSPAVDILQRLLIDEQYAGQCDDILDALAAAGGVTLGQDFVVMLQQECRFWREEAPNLKVGWWNGTGLDWARVEVLRSRYSKVLHVLYGLKQMKYSASRNDVQLFRDFWRSLPQLEDKSGLNQMSQTCDAVLASLEHAK